MLCLQPTPAHELWEKQDQCPRKTRELGVCSRMRKHDAWPLLGAPAAGGKAVVTRETGVTSRHDALSLGWSCAWLCDLSRRECLVTGVCRGERRLPENALP